MPKGTPFGHLEILRNLKENNWRNASTTRLVQLLMLGINLLKMKACLTGARYLSRRHLSVTATVDTIRTAIGTLPAVSTPTIVNTGNFDKWPVFRILDNVGKVVAGASEPVLGEDEALKMYQHMVRIQ